MTSGDLPAAPPSGTVTLLFADVEGSTRLLHALGERYATVRARLKELVQEASARWNGHEVDWAGDGAFLAFPAARDALAAAADIQRAIAKEPWPDDGVLRVRIGLHTGEPERVDHGYVGLDVHVAARVCAAGHGDQVVVSQATREVAGDEPAGDLLFRPLGRHRLKDLSEPLQLFQLAGPGLAEDFPPLRTLAGATLPALHHRLVGRDADLTAVQSLLTRPDVRLVTIVGPGGAGKSRLALEVAGAAAVHRPVHLVGLATISDPELVPAAIARAVGVREGPGRTLGESLGESLSETGALVFLDNLEHLPGAATHVRDLLDRAAGVKVLATSRVPLRLQAEHVVPLSPLPVHDASVLFAELAAARGVVLRDDARAAIAEICRRLDGLPLAIELVAARLVVLPPTHVLEALDHGLALEMEGPVDLPERQRTLRATIEWSYGQLDERQRELHEALAVFAGGCTLADARALAGSGPHFLADLESLVAWSLVRSDVAEGDVRLSMLETVREHAVARLESSGRLDDLRRRHAERFLELAATAEEELTGAQHAEWIELLERELDNIRAALDWFVSSGRAEDALRMTAALARFWHAHAHISEARRWLSIGLDLAGDVPAATRAAALWTAAQQATAQSDWEAAVPLLEEARELYREAGQRRDESLALSYLGFVALRRDDLEGAASLSEEAVEIAREIGDARAESAALMALADVRSARDDHASALDLYEQAVVLRRTLRDPVLVLDAIYNLGLTAYQGGDHTRARTELDEALRIARGLDEAPYVAAAQFMLAELDLAAEDPAAAEQRARESLAVYTELEDERSCARCLVVLAGAATLSGRLEEGARLLGAAAALRGDAPPDLFESPIIDSSRAHLETALGERRLTELEAEGADREVKSAVGQVVSSRTEE